MLDADGATLASFDYFQPTTEVVAGLTEYLGAPVDRPNPGGIESPPGVDHEWGGLRLFDSDTPGTPPENPNHYGVMVLSYDDSGVIERLSAPSANFGV